MRVPTRGTVFTVGVGGSGAIGKSGVRGRPWAKSSASKSLNSIIMSRDIVKLVVLGASPTHFIFPGLVSKIFRRFLGGGRFYRI